MAIGTFEKVQGDDSAVAACFDAVRTRILSGEIAAGAKLPPERALAAALGVNRLTLRSALARLSASNLLHVRQGSGYVVRPWRREGGPDLLAGLVDLASSERERRDIARDLLAVRRQIAVAVLERLAVGVSASSQVSVTDAVERFAALASADDTTHAALVEADLDVMGAIASATGSAVFALCMNPIGATLRSMPGLSLAMFAAPTENVLGYRALLAWMSAPSRASIPAIVRLLEERDEATLSRLSTERRTRS